MTLEASVLMTLRFVSFSLLLQAVEIFILSRRSDFQHIWSYKNLATDLEQGLPLSSQLTQKLFSIPMLQIIAAVQILISVAAATQPHVGYFIILFITHLYICIRFRGSFNGGSDMMTFIVLTGAIISTSGFPKIGLIYIATHALYSYFKAGLAKIKYAEWRNGQAIKTFLSRSLFPDIKKLANTLEKHPLLTKTIGWLTLLFELAIIALLIRSNIAPIYFSLAIIFHLSIYFVFGLNRFFWIWLTTWPSILFTISLLK